MKGIPPNVSETEILTELNKLNVQVIRVTQITKIDKVTRNILTKYPIFIITFAPGTDVHKIIHINKLCHCLVKWEKFKNSRPVKQCFNCQSFGHSSNYCGRPPRCVKCNQPHATKDCTKPAGAPPTCVNCNGDHPANFTGCPQYQLQLQSTYRSAHQQLRQVNKPQTTSPQFHYQKSAFPPLQSTHVQFQPSQTWARVTAQSSTPRKSQSYSSTFDTLKSILAMFDLNKLSTQLCALAQQLREANDPITKIVAVIDTIVNCLSQSP